MEFNSPWIILVRKHGCHDVTRKRPIRYSVISLELSLHFRRSQVCPNCGTKFPTCIVSGRPLMDYQFWMCGTCKHRAYEQEISTLNHCPLCHAPIWFLMLLVWLSLTNEANIYSTPHKWIVLLAHADWSARKWLAKYYLPPSIERRAKL